MSCNLKGCIAKMLSVLVEAVSVPSLLVSEDIAVLEALCKLVVVVLVVVPWNGGEYCKFYIYISVCMHRLLSILNSLIDILFIHFYYHKFEPFNNNILFIYRIILQ